MENFKIFAPRPPAGLSQNARSHWRAKAKLTSNYRFEGWAACRAGDIPKLQAKEATIAVRFNFHDQRRRDVQNFMASIKSLVDGIVDYGLLSDDDQITWPPPIITIDTSVPIGVYLDITIK